MLTLNTTTSVLLRTSHVQIGILNRLATMWQLTSRALRLLRHLQALSHLSCIDVNFMSAVFLDLFLLYGGADITIWLNSLNIDREVLSW